MMRTNRIIQRLPLVLKQVILWDGNVHHLSRHLALCSLWSMSNEFTSSRIPRQVQGNQTYSRRSPGNLVGGRLLFSIDCAKSKEF